MIGGDSWAGKIEVRLERLSDDIQVSDAGTLGVESDADSALQRWIFEHKDKFVHPSWLRMTFQLDSDRCKSKYGRTGYTGLPLDAKTKERRGQDLNLRLETRTDSR